MPFQEKSEALQWLLSIYMEERKERQSFWSKTFPKFVASLD